MSYLTSNSEEIYGPLSILSLRQMPNVHYAGVLKVERFNDVLCVILCLLFLSFCILFFT